MARWIWRTVRVWREVWMTYAATYAHDDTTEGTVDVESIVGAEDTEDIGETERG